MFIRKNMASFWCLRPSHTQCRESLCPSVPLALYHPVSLSLCHCIILSVFPLLVSLKDPYLFCPPCFFYGATRCCWCPKKYVWTTEEVYLNRTETWSLLTAYKPPHVPLGRSTCRCRWTTILVHARVCACLHLSSLSADVVDDDPICFGVWPTSYHRSIVGRAQSHQYDFGPS